MDVVLEFADTFLFDYIYATLLPARLDYSGFTNTNGTVNYTKKNTTPYVYRPASQYISFQPSEWAYKSSMPRDNIFRQINSLFLITWVFGFVLYFSCATLSYAFVFDKSALHHPKFIKNQIKMEIQKSLAAFPGLSALTVPFFLLEIRGYSKIYDAWGNSPLNGWYNYIQFPLFICFTDFLIYWVHRWLHHPLVYKHLHKPHHKWIVPTPFASHAFHPVDGWLQSVPYHLYVFILPLNKFVYVALFVFVNVWAVMIHDGEYVTENPFINGAACHTIHHLYFNFNFGQFTTLWDRIGGSYRKPDEELFKREIRFCKSEIDKQIKEYEEVVKKVEGKDERSFLTSVPAKKTQ